MAGPIVEHRADHLRDDVARALDDDRIADPDVLAVDVLLVVQRGVPHDDAADLDGLELGEGVERAGASHVDLDREQLRGPGRGRELEGDRPARIAADRAERGLQREIVDLDDRAVDVVAERLAVALDRVAGLAHRLDARHRRDPRVDGEPAGGQPLQRLVVRAEHGALKRADAVAPERERPLRRDRRVELAQRPGRGVARVHVDGLASIEPFLVEALEGLERDVALAAHLDQRRRVRIIDRQRHGADRPHVGGDVLPGLAVAARHGALEEAVPVDERERETVDLRLDDEDGLILVPGLDQLLLQPLIPGQQLVIVARVGEREHRQQVAHLLEAARDAAADALRGRVRAQQARIRSLELAQLAERGVVGGIIDDRRVLEVVRAIPRAQLARQLLDALCAHPASTSSSSAGVSTMARGLSGASASRLKTPHVTPMLAQPAALADCRSNGESPM